MELPKQFDNINNRVIDDLKQTLSKGSKVSIAAASFSIYAYEALKKELEDVDELRFIFTSPTFNKAEIGKKENVSSLFQNLTENVIFTVRNMKFVSEISFLKRL